MYAPAKPTTNLYLYFFVLLFLQVSFSNLKPTYTVTPLTICPAITPPLTNGKVAVRGSQGLAARCNCSVSRSLLPL